MPGPTVLCPCCGKRLVCSYPPEPGQSMRCHGCGRQFTVPGKTPAKIAPTARRFPKAAVAAVVLAVFLSAGGVVLAVSYFGRMPPPVTAEAAPPVLPARKESAKPETPPREMPRPVQGATDINIEIVPPAPMPPDEARPEAMPDKMPDLPEPAPLPKDGLIKDWLPKKEQAMVDESVRRGVAYLKKSQAADGSWGGNGAHPVGATALPALALLECGVPPNDPAIRRAAGYLRKWVPSLNRTYETSLCILFFDRLRAAEDRPRIVTLSLRLLAGQQEDGGWSYTCPPLNRTDEANLLVALRYTRPQRTEELFTRDAPLLALYLPKETGSSMLKLDEQNPTPTSGTIEIALSGVTTKPPAAADNANAEPEAPPPPPARPEKPEPRPAGKPDARAALTPEARRAVDKLPARLRGIPALPPIANNNGGHNGGQVRGIEMRGRIKHHHTDNSNTQFAIIALWAARRHQVPMDRALAQIVSRFHMSQNVDGSWQYHSTPTRGAGPGRATMTGAALIGLGVGYGLTLPNGAARDKGIPANPQLVDGLKSLGNSLEGDRGEGFRFKRGADLYYWWTVERVAVLYGLRSFQGRPWYETGVADIVPAQADDGSWTYQMGGAGQPVGTAFALLFLRGSNLVSDLTQTIKGGAIKK